MACNMVPIRQLGATLFAAASTIALFVAASWDISWIIPGGASIWERFFWHSIAVYVLPLLPVFGSVHSCLEVWAVKRHLKSAHNAAINMNHNSVSIMTLCPLYIPVPSKSISTLMAQGKYLLQKDSEVYKLSPLELQPPIRASGSLQAKQTNAPTDVDEETEPHGIVDASPPSAGNEEEIRYFLSLDPRSFEALKERELLLALGLVPEYRQLRFLRTRSSFQASVTALQAGGYVLGIIQRMLQWLAISPVEATLTFLCLVAMGPLLMDQYACTHYQRPLLLRLNEDQWDQFHKANRNPFYSKFAERANAATLAFVVLIFIVSSFPLWYYALHILHTCHLCSLSIFLFLLALTTSIVAIALVCFVITREHTFQILIKLSTTTVTIGNIYSIVKEELSFIFLAIFTFLSFCLFAPSTILALVSTIERWDEFNTAATNLFAWIIPHVPTS